jgi:hypothetical protein
MGVRAAPTMNTSGVVDMVGDASRIGAAGAREHRDGGAETGGYYTNARAIAPASTSRTTP